MQAFAEGEYDAWFELGRSCRYSSSAQASLRLVMAERCVKKVLMSFRGAPFLM
jgi:hypothetical protein